MLVLNNNDIGSLLSFQQVLQAVEEAMVFYEKEPDAVPRRMHLDHGPDTLLCMPSFGKEFFGTKLVSVVPGNTAENLPVTNGLMVLNDTRTGLPLAILNASKLTALRTGAVGAVGIKYMTPENSSSVGLIGCGIQGMHQAVFACSVRPVNTIHVLVRTKETFQRTKEFIREHHPRVKVKPNASSEELLSKTDIIIAASRSATPILNNHSPLLRGKHFISVGSYKPSMQELPDEVYRLAGQLVIDSEFARHETGDTVLPVKKGILKEENIFTIGKLITGEKKTDRNATTVYKSAGMALFDLFVGQSLYLAAKEKKAGTTVSF